MKVLIVASGNTGRPGSFVEEQADNLKKLGVIIDFYLIKGKGIIGYLRNLRALKAKIKKSHPDIIHAHYGLSGFLCAIQFFRPLIITYHGSDVELKGIRIISKISMILSSHIILVNSKQINNLPFSLKNFSLIPCGIYIEKFFPIDQKIARNYFGFSEEEILVLFSSRFDNHVKNFPLASKIISSINESKKLSIKIKLIEFKNYSREETNLLYNAVDLLIVTSHHETGPLVVKEALSSGCPVVSTNVGDVSEVMKYIDRNWICNSIEDFKAKISDILIRKERFLDVQLLKKYDNKIASINVMNLYSKIIC